MQQTYVLGRLHYLCHTRIRRTRRHISPRPPLSAKHCLAHIYQTLLLVPSHQPFSLALQPCLSLLLSFALSERKTRGFHICTYRHTLAHTHAHIHTLTQTLNHTPLHKSPHTQKQIQHIKNRTQNTKHKKLNTCTTHRCGLIPGGSCFSPFPLSIECPELALSVDCLENSPTRFFFARQLAYATK